jgi:hypothetical protein
MNIKTTLSTLVPFFTALSFVLTGINAAHAITTVASGAERYSRPKISNDAEIVWSQRAGETSTVWSNQRGQISFGHLDNDPDINDEGEIIWRFGDGGQGPDGIQSNIRGLIYSEQGGALDPYYDTHRINNTGEIIWSRSLWPTGYRAEEIWSNYRGRLTYSPEYAINRETAINNNGEVVYRSYLGPTGNTYDILSTERGEITSDSMWEWHPDINISGEVVWSQKIPEVGDTQKWEIWSNKKGRITDNNVNDEFPSINDEGEIVWQHWDGNDYEIMSNIRGQITDNNVDDLRPDINNLGTIVWMSNNRKAILAMYSVSDTTVIIDINPQKSPNVINLKSGGFTSVAVLTNGEIDALQVDPGRAKFGPGAAMATRYRVKDVDRDGDEDLLMYFRIQQAGIDCSSTEATLIGALYDGTHILGTDYIHTKNCQ